MLWLQFMCASPFCCCCCCRFFSSAFSFFSFLQSSPYVDWAWDVKRRTKKPNIQISHRDRETVRERERAAMFWLVLCYCCCCCCNWMVRIILPVPLLHKPCIVNKYTRSLYHYFWLSAFLSLPLPLLRTIQSHIFSCGSGVNIPYSMCISSAMYSQTIAKCLFVRHQQRTTTKAAATAIVVVVVVVVTAITRTQIHVHICIRTAHTNAQYDIHIARITRSMVQLRWWRLMWMCMCVLMEKCIRSIYSVLFFHEVPS